MHLSLFALLKLVNHGLCTSAGTGFVCGAIRGFYLTPEDRARFLARYVRPSAYTLFQNREQKDVSCLEVFPAIELADIGAEKQTAKHDGSNQV